MSRRTTGVLFIVMAAFLLGIKYVCAAIFGSNVTTWTAELFSNLLSYIGTRLSTLSLLALIIGIVYLVWAEIEAWLGHHAERGGKPPSSHK